MSSGRTPNPTPNPNPEPNPNPNPFPYPNPNPNTSLNHWVLLELPRVGTQEMHETNMAVVTLECAGVLEGEKALEILAHVEAAWARGQQAVSLLRQEIPAETVDVIAPLWNGGVHLHKLFGVMHDTCHAANKVPSHACV